MAHKTGPVLASTLALAALTACGPSLDPRSLVSGLRLLAVQAEPAEVEPGAEITYRALVTDPGQDGAPLVYGFLQCTPGAAGCLEQEEALAASGGDAEAAEIAYQKTSVRYGLGTVEDEILVAVGANMQAAETLLDGAANPEEGANNQVTAFVCDAETCLSGVSPSAEAAGGLPAEASVIAVKRARISTSAAPNHNPVFLDLRVGVDAGAGGGASAADPVPPQLTVGQPVTVAVTLPLEAAEPYVYVTDDGVPESRTERLYVGWYATGGEFESSTSLLEEVGGQLVGQVSFTPPAAEASLGVYAVAWDRRGGIGWITGRIEVVP